MKKAWLTISLLTVTLFTLASMAFGTYNKVLADEEQPTSLKCSILSDCHGEASCGDGVGGSYEGNCRIRCTGGNRINCLNGSS